MRDVCVLGGQVVCAAFLVARLLWFIISGFFACAAAQLRRLLLAPRAYLPPPASASNVSRALISVLRMSIAIVMGPTPPGTGVIALACSRAAL